MEGPSSKHLETRLKHYSAELFKTSESRDSIDSEGSATARPARPPFSPAEIASLKQPQELSLTQVLIYIKKLYLLKNQLVERKNKGEISTSELPSLEESFQFAINQIRTIIRDYFRLSISPDIVKAKMKLEKTTKAKTKLFIELGKQEDLLNQKWQSFFIELTAFLVCIQHLDSELMLSNLGPEVKNYIEATENSDKLDKTLSQTFYIDEPTPTVIDLFKTQFKIFEYLLKNFQEQYSELIMFCEKHDLLT